MRRTSVLLTALLFVFTYLSPCFAVPSSDKIIDGTAANESTYPYVARLSVDGDLLCTGTLVANKYILTAAHCFFDERNRRAVGDAQITARLDGHQYQSSRIFIHPSYRPRSSACVEQEVDAALIELKQAVVGVAPISLLASAAPTGASLLLAGYGTLGRGDEGEDGTLPALGTLYVGYTTIEGYGDNPPRQNASSTYFYWAFDRGESNTASGDSGGPSFLDVFGQRYIAGITCGGDGNAEIGTLSFNTRADVIKPWVDSIAGTTPTSSAPGFANSAPRAGRLGEAFSYEVPLTGSGPLTLSAVGLPPGLILNGATISGVPTVAGAYTVQLTASNSLGEANEELLITISGFQPSLIVRRALLQFDYDEAAKDFLDVTGKIAVGRKFNPRGKAITVQMGRFIKTFKLKANGESAGPGKSYFDLVGAFRGKVFKNSSVSFYFVLEREAFAEELATLGFSRSAEALDGQRVSLPLAVTINGIEASATVSLEFRSRDERWHSIK